MTPSASVPAKLSIPTAQAVNSPPMTITWLMAPDRFGPMRSTSRPLTTRSTAPASVGVATINPFCAGVRASAADIAGASGPSSTHTMKARSK
jgi:hypothetical protein